MTVPVGPVDSSHIPTRLLTEDTGVAFSIDTSLSYSLFGPLSSRRASFVTDSISISSHASVLSRDDDDRVLLVETDLVTLPPLTSVLASGATLAPRPDRRTRLMRDDDDDDDDDDNDLPTNFPSHHANNNLSTEPLSSILHTKTQTTTFKNTSTANPNRRATFFTNEASQLLPAPSLENGTSMPSMTPFKRMPSLPNKMPLDRHQSVPIQTTLDRNVSIPMSDLGFDNLSITSQMWSQDHVSGTGGSRGSFTPGETFLSRGQSLPLSEISGTSFSKGSQSFEPSLLRGRSLGWEGGSSTAEQTSLRPGRSLGEWRDSGPSSGASFASNRLMQHNQVLQRFSNINETSRAGLGNGAAAGATVGRGETALPNNLADTSPGNHNSLVNIVDMTNEPE
mmetsp:Transcript_26968/g.32717  ORF Transcript_26968/g.32717 Transcript_26968/m.32717 type:complete len:394 (-) Transcript_26968:136-1317(-)